MNTRNANFKTQLLQSISAIEALLAELEALGVAHDRSTHEHGTGYSMATIVALNLRAKSLQPLRKYLERLRSNAALLDRND